MLRERMKHVVLVMVGLTCLGIAFLGPFRVIDFVRDLPERNERELMRLQMLELQNTTRRFIFVSNETGDGGVEEFLENLDRLDGLTDIELHIEYSHRTDDILARMRGLRGVQTLVMHQNDVTDEGMEHIATLPDLERLILHRICITDEGVARLALAPKLTKLGMAPASGEGLTVAVAVTLPNIRELSLDEPFTAHWLKKGLEQIDQAPALESLRLFGGDLSAEDVERLRQRLPHCNVRAFKWGAGPDQEEIAPQVVPETIAPLVPQAK